MYIPFQPRVSDLDSCVPSNDLACPSPETRDTQPATQHGVHLTHQNLVGLLVVCALVLAGFVLWLFFGRWAKPIRQFCRCDRRTRKAQTTKIPQIRFEYAGDDTKVKELPEETEASKLAALPEVGKGGGKVCLGYVFALYQSDGEGGYLEGHFNHCQI